MPICIECRYPVGTLYTTYSKADDKALGKGVRLTQCPRCKRFADKYVEHDFVVLFIDLVLLKPPVYRHLLFNRLGRDGDQLHPSIIRLGVLLLLFDVYLTWARIEKVTSSSSEAAKNAAVALLPSPLAVGELMNTTGRDLNLTDMTTAVAPSPISYLASQPILLQYIFFLALCTLETTSFHLPIRTLLSIRFPRPISFIIPYYPHAALVSTALLVSSFTKLFPLLLLIWEYDLPSSASAVSWAVIINNVAALEILLDCGYFRAIILAAIGAVFRAGVGWGILRTVGVSGAAAAAGVVETGDLIDVWKRLMDHVGLG